MSPALWQPGRRAWLTSAWHDRTRVAAVATVVTIVAAVGALVKVPTYTASASLLVLMSDDYANRPSALVSTPNAPGMVMERDAIIQSESSILSSTTLGKDVINALGLEHLYPDLAQGAWWQRLTGMASPSPLVRLEQGTQRFEKNLNVVPDKHGNTLTVTFAHADPRLAVEALNNLVALYQRKRAAIYANPESALLAATAEASHDELDRVGAQLAAFQSRSGISDFGVQMDLLLRQLADLKRQQQTAQTEAVEAGERVTTLSGQAAATPREVVQYTDTEADRRVQAIRDSLADLQRQESLLRQTYTEQSQKVQAVRRQIEAMQGELARAADTTPSAERRGLNEVHTTVELGLLRAQSESASVVQRRRELSSQVASVESQVRQLQEKRAELEGLIRQKSLAEQAYVNATRALQERRSVEDIEARRAANVRVIEPPDAPLKPTPVRLVILLGGLFTAVLAGIATAALCHRFRRGYIEPDTLAADLGIPVLASVLRTHTPAPRLGFHTASHPTPTASAP